MDQYADQLIIYLHDKKPEQYQQMLAGGKMRAYLNRKTQAARERKRTLIEAGVPNDMAEEQVLAHLLA